MSNRMIKMGNKIWFAFGEALSAGGGGEGFRVRISEIAKHASVSKPTIQKYMDMAVSKGSASVRVVSGTRYYGAGADK